MIQSLFFYYTFSKKQFTRALACYSDFPRIETPFMHYACYRLGMYHTVAKMPFYTGGNWRGGFARAVSLSACGRHEEAQKQAEAWLNTVVADPLKANLANCLAPYHPKLAYSIVQNTSAPLLLRAALYLQVGQDGQARDILTNLLNKDSVNLYPESHLYNSNATQSMTPSEKLDSLNEFLGVYCLPHLRLIDEQTPPGPMNVQIAGDVATTGGPLVSILMTAYNSSDRIATAIHSVLNQSYSDLELIVVDDASIDSTCSIVKTIADSDQRVKFIRLPRNVGTYAAKNIGMQHTTGEFVTCHDSDDWSHPEKIARQVDPLLQNRKIVFTTSHWLRMQDDGIYYARPVHPLMRINPASPLFRRKQVLEHAGIWDQVRTGADSEFFSRLKLVFGHKAMKRVVQPLTLGSHRPNSLMTAKDTGYSAEALSPTRLAYWEAWNNWHIEELRARRQPYMSSSRNMERQFDVPDTIRVPSVDIEACARDYSLYGQ